MLQVDLKRLRAAIDGMEQQRQRQARLLTELQARLAALAQAIAQEERLEESHQALGRQMDELEELSRQHMQLLRCLRLAERSYTWTRERVEHRCERSAVAWVPVTELTIVSLKRLRCEMRDIRFTEVEHHGNRANRHSDGPA